MQREEARGSWMRPRGTDLGRQVHRWESGKRLVRLLEGPVWELCKLPALAAEAG